MFHSRIRFSNEHVSLAFDAQTGELLELTDVVSGDDLIKNFPPHTHQPLWLTVRKPINNDCGHKQLKDQEAVYAFDNKIAVDDEQSTEAWPVLISGNSDPSAWICCERENDGTQCIKIHYSAMETESGPLDIEAFCEINLPAGSAILRWRLSLINHTDYLIEKAAFPAVYGVYFNDSWKTDTLVYPYFSGEKIIDPVEEYAKEPSVIHWKWQNYRHSYLLDGTFRWKNPYGAYCREMTYGGSVSMPWMDYYGETAGLYLACHETGARVLSMRCETYGPKSPGMGFSIVHHPYAKDGVWRSPECVMALHPGDWHWAADFYRSSRKASDGLEQKTRPEWLDTEPGLVAHYDFMYQNGGVVHRFADIPGLYRQARKMGISVLLLSGWHEDGFDCGFPRYVPGKDLGGAEELKQAVHQVSAEGGHVLFYMNARLDNTAYQDLREERNAQCARDINGKLITATYGDKGIIFANRCPNETAWQDHIANRVEYLIKEIGASGVYLDQLAMASPIFCFHPKHKHHPADWCIGNKKLLRRIFERFESEEKPVIFYEGANDLYGTGVSGQLISTFVHKAVDAFPELYRYTFPEQLLIDMVYPQRMQAMRPVAVAQQGLQILHDAFLVGMFLWIYDLEEDNSFYNDPDMLQKLMQVIGLRKVWLSRFGTGTFRDEEGIVSVPQGIRVKRFSLPSDDLLLTVSNPLCVSQNEIVIDQPFRDDTNIGIKCYLPDNPEKPTDIPFCIKMDRLILSVPKSEIALIWIHQDN